MRDTLAVLTDKSAGRPAIGGRLSQRLREQLGAAADTARAASVALLASNFWLRPEVAADIDDDPRALIAEITGFVRREAASAAYRAEYRRANAAVRRAVAALQAERRAYASPHRTAPSPRGPNSRPALSAFQRVQLAQARCGRIQAAGANLWRRIERRACKVEVMPRSSATPVMRRPRARRSHRVVRVAKASGDSGDSDGEPARAHSAERGALHAVANTGVS